MIQFRNHSELCTCMRIPFGHINSTVFSLLSSEYDNKKTGIEKEPPERAALIIRGMLYG